MICSLCSGLVIWKGPITALTHTECQKCGAINCQEIGTDPDDELFDDEGDLVEGYDIPRDIDDNLLKVTNG